MDKAGIIKQCQQGNLEGFSEIYKAYSKNALGTAYLIAGQRSLAEDIVQEAFIQCMNGINKVKNIETFDAWFYRILVRTGWRVVLKYKNTVSLDSLKDEGLYNSTNLPDQAESFETCLSVNEALEKLSVPLKTVIILYYYNEMTIKEISKVLGCFEGTVKSRLHNAKKLLRKILKENEPETGHVFNLCERRTE